MKILKIACCESLSRALPKPHFSLFSGWILLKRVGAFGEHFGSPSPPRGGQKGAKKDPRSEKVTFRKHKYSLNKTTLFEARGGQKAPQGAPQATSKVEEKTKSKKEGQRAAPETSATQEV